MSVYVYVSVCPLPRLVITSGMMRHDMDLYDWLNKFYNFYMTAAVNIISRHGLTTELKHIMETNLIKVSYLA